MASGYIQFRFRSSRLCPPEKCVNDHHLLIPSSPGQTNADYNKSHGMFQTPTKFNPANHIPKFKDQNSSIYSWIPTAIDYNYKAALSIPENT
ncbi:hypothetical protein RRG08_026857 [Elysia crispata]|uniref:Uncharacterized protein n=1 Tax=Elysia crispata TaxID=231223 RepID=A0AAE1CTJ5_9GAST|nr:hypothetical protein RRG08_026857 [Elysia crispata]